MADAAALYALIGAVGGAVLGAGGAVLGPLLLHRRQAEERREALLRQEEREQAQQRREEGLLQRQQQFELQVAELDRQAAAGREHALEVRARQLAAMERLKHMRSTTRAWHLLLSDTFHELMTGRPVAAEAFSEAWHAARDAVNESFDEALHDGLWFAHSRSAQLLIGRGSLNRALTRNGHGIDVTTLGQALSSATYTIANCVEAGYPLSEDLIEEARSALRHLNVARESLRAHITGRLASLGVEVDHHLEHSGEDG
ncbi:hypothetical protein [Streptomyces sp. WM6372]|uniref:hypothetical protein n=1 Tax=Streptomyces sp. WM6372 TaxID=1415555 RepID=UPI00131D68CB|nr:hypothetical protein [Streptomyces sp. WM6372]